ncbi:PEP-CTERM sorting domain-containing protein [Aeoliella sp. ICT_H6.2]|uniref:PEP-CTERM sorting domain-containing protein n=1 Tax=Aeoliella straminimaris TaxID=2954799 RepID=A0A9X2JI23_9BACT|nr:PEP-CTERM sorting domain-containing protein [Aeoliella straminimaris]MCO6046645.1 PEP-CTERM sorting domain-containing protein [Aeoliella straminimaris]
MNAALLCHGLREILLAVTLVATAWTTARAGTMMLIDDFNDGNDDGWTTVDTNEGESWGPGSMDPTSFAYHFSTPQDVPLEAPYRGAMSSVWDQSSDPLYTNGLWRAKVRADAVDSGATILLRYTGSLETGFSLYAFSAFGGRGFGFNRYEDSFLTDSMEIPGVAVGLGEEWWIEAGAVGDQLSMKVWRDGEPEPTQPQLAFTDATLPVGRFALQTNINFASDTVGPINTTFDDVYFTPVPEPSTALMTTGLIGMLLGLRWRRCR